MKTNVQNGRQRETVASLIEKETSGWYALNWYHVSRLFDIESTHNNQVTQLGARYGSPHQDFYPR